MNTTPYSRVCFRKLIVSILHKLGLQTVNTGEVCKGCQSIEVFHFSPNKYILSLNYT